MNSGDTVLQRLVGEVDGNRLWAHLEAFSKWTKLAGTPGELESLGYVRACLDDYGFATELISHDAFISLPGTAAISVDGERHACITQSFSQPAPAGGLTAPVIDVGDGSGFDDADVRGKIVLIDGIATPAVSQRASRSGAVGQIHICPHEHVHEMCISPVWGSPGLSNLDELPTSVVVTIPLSLGLRIRERLENGEPDIVIEAEVDTGWRKTPILVAALDRNDAAGDEPFVMFSGHHDTWYYGVMDNGGANATMLEVARLAVEARGDWRRGIRLYFWSGHSQGRYSSSSWYADQHWHELERRAVAHVNIDSTGASGNTVLTDAQASAELVDLAREAVGQQGGQDLTGHRVARAGDQSFWGIGIPSIFAALGEQPADGAAPVAKFLFGGPGKKGAGTGWWWHTPDDTLDKMDREIAIRDTRVYLHAVWKLLAAPVIPLNYADWLDHLCEVLRGFGDDLGDRFDLSLATELAATLSKELKHATGEAAVAADAGLVNRRLLCLSRCLVPLDYTSGDRFTPDPALGQGPFPVLDPLRALGRAPAGTDQEKHAAVEAMRAYNRLCAALMDAVQMLRRDDPDGDAGSRGRA